jgi:hypothetical protein
MATRRASSASSSSTAAKKRAPSVEAGSVLGIAEATLTLVRKPAVRAHLLRVPPEELSAAQLDAYPGLVAEAKRTRNAYSLVGSAEGDALVPLSVVTDAVALRTRMLDCLAYNLEENAEVQDQLAAIRRGAGYADLAADLEGLQALYGTHAAAVRVDVRKYRATDAADAARLASAIRVARAGGERPDTKEAAKAWSAAFYALRAVHDDIVAAGRYLDRRDPTLAARWVLLNRNLGPATPKKAKPPKA